MGGDGVSVVEKLLLYDWNINAFFNHFFYSLSFS
jgi:hypothetical protein